MADAALAWNCPSCGAKNLQGDVCPFCGTFNNAPKKKVSYKGTSQPAAPNYNTSYREFTSVAAPTYETPAASNKATDWLASLSPAIIPQEGPVTSDDFFALGKKPFIFNKGNTGRVEGTSRGIATSWWAYLTPVLLFGLMAIFTAMSLPNYQLVTSLEARGMDAAGTVTNKYSRTSTGKNRTTTYYLVYNYTVGGKTYPTIEQSVSFNIYNVNNQGSKVVVRYLPENPMQARLGGDDKDDDNIKNGFYALIAGWTGYAVMCILILNHVMRNWKLVGQGQLVTGRIVGSHISRNKNSYTLHLTYAFTSPTSGRTLQRKESTGRNDLRKSSAPASGLPVSVLYVDDRTYRVM